MNPSIVYCISNWDCQNFQDKPVCKESIPGGAKSCQASETCSQTCAEGLYCDAYGTCQNGKR